MCKVVASSVQRINIFHKLYNAILDQGTLLELKVLSSVDMKTVDMRQVLWNESLASCCNMHIIKK